MDSVNTIFELLAVSPLEADKKAVELLKVAKSQDEQDGINWARAYALVELKRFSEALGIWQEMFERTQSHKALHQIGFVHRSANNLAEAFDIFAKERSLIAGDDIQAVAINLYELSYCSHLLGNIEQAHDFFKAYEALDLEESDLVERGCFFRLKGDIYKSRDKSIAKTAYERSLKFFQEANDEVSSVEVMDLLLDL